MNAHEQAREHLLIAAKEFDRCIKCGKCRSVCPVFRVMANELFVARGKLKIAQMVADGTLPITKRVREALDECLICKTCTANCPSGVRTEEVVLRLRWYITTMKGLHFVKAIIFRFILWQRWPLTIGAKCIGLAQRIFFGIGPKNPVRLLFPLFGISHRRNFPKFALRSTLGKYPEVVPAVGKPKMRVGYFVGCAANFIYTKTADAVIDVLTHYGYEVVIPKAQKCNGTPVFANGDYDGAKKFMEHNFALFDRYKLDAIVVACSSCGLSLKKEIAHFIPDTAQRREFTGKVYDIHEFIEKHITLAPKDLAPLNKSVTYHDPCHLGRGQGVTKEPRAILKKIPGVNFVEMKNPDVCCGGAGSYSVTHYTNSVAINRQKTTDIKNADTELVATGCPICVMHMQDNLIQNNLPQQTTFVIELLAESLRKKRETEPVR
ncbi:MAG: (Fe-S)-binding protein [Spirochaetes bacterium]|nr:(Fe-S)-binding protein [Spirochaetota bacterium]